MILSRSMIESKMISLFKVGVILPIQQHMRRLERAGLCDMLESVNKAIDDLQLRMIDSFNDECDFDLSFPCNYDS